MKFFQKPLIRDLVAGFVWSLIILAVIWAPGVYNKTIHFVYTAF